MKSIDTGGAAFPLVVDDDHATEINRGMTLRDWFATLAPAPSRSEIDSEYAMDCHRNPHNDNYKPARRTALEIEAELRGRWADAMIAEKRRAEGRPQ